MGEQGPAPPRAGGRRCGAGAPQHLGLPGARRRKGPAGLQGLLGPPLRHIGCRVRCDGCAEEGFVVHGRLRVGGRLGASALSRWRGLEKPFRILVQDPLQVVVLAHETGVVDGGLSVRLALAQHLRVHVVEVGHFLMTTMPGSSCKFRDAGGLQSKLARRLYLGFCGDADSVMSWVTLGVSEAEWERHRLQCQVQQRNMQPRLLRPRRAGAVSNHRKVSRIRNLAHAEDVVFSSLGQGELSEPPDDRAPSPTGWFARR
mmetsp:Transcript_5027/g.14806  ORF Transcript_5027/g.14806 Transcript_5027/m.14806 type:complete len:258 (-) Transcript_5027:71-844(-)